MSNQRSVNVDELTKVISDALEGHRGIAYMPGMLSDVARIAARAALGALYDEDRCESFKQRHIIADDPNPELSQLDRWDGLKE